MIEVKNLGVVYPDGTKALQNISFRVERGESLALIGTNGAGKSTLLLTLVGMVPPKEGEIYYDSVKLSVATLEEVRRNTGLVFQNPDDQLFMASIYDDLAFAPRNYRMPSEEISARVNEVMEQLGITHLKDRVPLRLSGGEKRLCALGGVLTMRPDNLFLDEPTSFLDPRARKELITLIKGIEATKIIATHDLDMALEACGRVIIIKDGGIFADGPAALLEDEVLLNEAGLELPLGLAHRR